MSSAEIEYYWSGAVTINTGVISVATDTEAQVKVQYSDNQDFSRKISSKIVPLISSDCRDSFEWDGKGIISENEKKILHELVIKVHNEKKEIRFWGSPDNKNTWEALLSAGVDLINTDNIEECRNFIIQQGKY